MSNLIEGLVYCFLFMKSGSRADCDVISHQKFDPDFFNFHNIQISLTASYSHQLRMKHLMGIFSNYLLRV